MNDLIKQLIEAVRAHRKAKDEWDAACYRRRNDWTVWTESETALQAAVVTRKSAIMILAGRIADHQPVQTEGGG